MATARKMVIALSALVATRPTFGSPARRSAWRARVVGVLLAPTASLAVARPASRVSHEFTRTRRKLGYVMDNDSIRTAVAAWIDDATAAAATYGHISTWDVSGVTDMSYLFCARHPWMDADSDFNGCQLPQSASSFNENIGAWDISGVTSMYRIFRAVSDFDQDLGWCVDRDVLDPGGGGAVESAVHESSCESTMCGIIVPITDARGITHRSCDGAITGFAIDDASIRPAVALWLADRAAAISTYGDISTWETSGVTDMSSLFSAESSFNEDISAWDTSGVTDMDSMFEEASAFNQPLSNWRVDKVTSMHEMFSGASAFDQDLGWCVSDGVDRVSAFLLTRCASTSCGIIRSIVDARGVVHCGGPITGFAMDDSHIVTAVTVWFSDPIQAEALYGHISTWETGDVTDMKNLFPASSSFNEDISGWDVSNVVDTSGMFYLVSSFNRPLGAWRVDKVTTMRGMFYGAAAFNQDLRGWRVSQVTDMENMFAEAAAFDQDLGWCVDAGLDLDGAFDKTLCAWQACGVHSKCFMTDSNIRTAVAAWVSDAAAAEAAYGHMSSWETSAVTDMANLFCEREAWMEGDADFDTCVLPKNDPGIPWKLHDDTSIIDAWDTSSVTTMRRMFRNSPVFNQPIGSWRVDEVTDMSEMFSGAHYFNQPLNAWDVSEVKNMRSMFDDALSFQQPLFDWDIDKVTDMSNMFNNARAFDQALSWCVHDDVAFAGFSDGTACASTSCGVVRGDCGRITGGTPTTPDTHTPITSGEATIEGSFTCAGISLADASAHNSVFVAAVSYIYAVDWNMVIVDIPWDRRRLQSGSFLVQYIVYYNELAEAMAALPPPGAHYPEQYRLAIHNYASDFGVSSVFNPLYVEAVADPWVNSNDDGCGNGLRDGDETDVDCGGSVCKPCDEDNDDDWVQWAWVEGDMSLWAVSFVLFAGLVLYCVNRCREGALVWSKETVGGGGAILVVTAFIVWLFAFQVFGWLLGLCCVAYGYEKYKAYKKKQAEKSSKVAPARSRSSAFAGAAAGAATGADAGGPTMEIGGSTLSAMEIDILGPLSGVLSALPAVAPPPLNMCLMPFAHALAELGHAVRRMRFNKEAAVLLQRRGIEIAQKLQDVVQATQGLPTGQVEAVARTVTAIGQALDEAAKFLQQFSKKGAFSKLCSGTLDARRFGLLDKRLCELSTELGSALDLQQLALQAQRFEKIEGLIQLLSQQTIDANNQAAAQRAAELCGMAKGSAVEHEELSALGLKMDRIAADVSTVIDQNAHQQESLDEVKEMVAAKNSKLRGRALARQDKERALEHLECELESVEEVPFAAGASGEVFSGQYQGDEVAVKRISLIGMTASGRAKVLKAFSTELAIMVKLRSPRIVQVFGVVTTDASYLGLVVEMCAGGALREALEADDYATAVDEAQRRRWLLDVALGMSYLYSQGVEHRDLKTLNVLLDGDRRRCKVSDFGLSQSESLNTAATQSTMGGGAKGTPAYMAPELLESNTFTEETDVYAYALVIWEVLTGDIPWRGLNPMQVGMQILAKQARPAVPEGAPADLVALMVRCWAHEPGARPKFAAIKAELLGSGPGTPAR